MINPVQVTNFDLPGAGVSILPNSLIGYQGIVALPHGHTLQQNSQNSCTDESIILLQCEHQ